MATKTRNLMIILYLFPIFSFLNAYLDLEELKKFNYGIELLSKPIDASEIFPSAESLSLSSKHGQKYHCSFPDRYKEQLKEKDEEKIAEDVGIPDLLKPMESSPCLVLTKDWWTYEFCYGKYIQQYHLEDGRPSGEIIYLGYYESEYKWDDPNSSTKEKHHEQLNRYHSQKYVNGTACDITTKPRKAEVRFQCEEGVGDTIDKIIEPESCAYIITVHTTKICHHPYLKPKKGSRLLVITCNPVLQHEQYLQYVLEKEARTRKMTHAKEMYSREANNNIYSTIVKDLKQNLDDRKFDDDPEPIKSPDTDVDGNNKEADDNAEDMSMKDLDAKFRQLNTPDDLMKFLNSMKNLERKSHLKDKGDDDDDDDDDDGEVEDENEDENKNTNDETNKKTEIKDGVDSELSQPTEGEQGSVFDEQSSGDLPSTGDTNIEEQFTQPTNDDVKPIPQPPTDTDQDILDDFDKGLKDLLLNDKEMEQLAAAKDTIRDAVSAKFNDMVEEAQAELKKDGDDPSDLDKKLVFKNLASTLNKLLNKLEKSNKELDEMDKELRKMAANAKESLKEKQRSADSESDLPPKTAPEDPLDGQEPLKVRVTKVKLTDRDKLSQKLTGQSVDDLPEEQRVKLEESVREELKRAGLDTGQNIHVKIITSVPKDGSEDNLHILSDEDSAAFNKMIVTILGGGNQDEMKELEWQNKMEQGYNFQWDKKTKKNKKRNQENSQL